MTVCDPIWQVTLRSSVMGFLYYALTFNLFLTFNQSPYALCTLVEILMTHRDFLVIYRTQCVKGFD